MTHFEGVEGCVSKTAVPRDMHGLQWRLLPCPRTRAHERCLSPSDGYAGHDGPGPRISQGDGWTEFWTSLRIQLVTFFS